MPRAPRTGTSIALAALVPRFLCAALLGLGGCLITDPAQIDDPLNTPPSIRSAPEAELDNVALNQIIRLSYAPDGELEIPIVVRDENLSDELVVQVWIDFRVGTQPNEFTGRPLYATLPVLSATGSADREHAIVIPHSLFGESDRCHRVEVFATRRFAPTTISHRQPETPGDLGTATFWVAMSAFGGVIDMSTCP